MGFLRFLERVLDTDMHHYRAVCRAVGGTVVKLTLRNAIVAGSNLELTYGWDNQLSYEQADQLDTRARAFLNCTVRKAAEAGGLTCRRGPSEIRLAGQPIPAWYLEGRSQETLVVNSQFDPGERLDFLTIGPPIADIHAIVHMSYDPVAEALKKSYERMYREIAV